MATEGGGPSEKDINACSRSAVLLGNNQSDEGLVMFRLPVCSTQTEKRSCGDDCFA